MELDSLIIMKMRPLAVQVCTSLNDEDAATEVNALHPTGISTGWEIDTDQGCFDCADNPGRRHIVFVC